MEHRSKIISFAPISTAAICRKGEAVACANHCIFAEGISEAHCHRNRKDTAEPDHVAKAPKIGRGHRPLATFPIAHFSASLLD
jgi:hypothetical protein